jgi:hypothetical protein
MKMYLRPKVLYNFMGPKSVIGRYEGSTPGTQPVWAFYDRGESLCVSGVVLTHITSYFRPSEGARTEGLASALQDGLSGKSKADQIKTAQSLSTIVALSAKNYMIAADDKLERWWEKLNESTHYVDGKEWIENLMVTDRDLRMANNIVDGVLRHEGLSAVSCAANSMCRGGPAFATMGARQGDTVALVSGVPYPLVLRPTANDQQRFRLIGPLFLPGVMDGELKEALTPDLFHDIMLV